MRFIVIFCLLIGAEAHAQTEASPELVDAFLDASRAEQNLGATLAGYVEQFSIDQSAEARAQFAKRLNASMGWSVIHSQYAALVARTYTNEELKAALTFLHSQEGMSFAQKTAGFQEQLGFLIAANAGEFTRASLSRPASAAPAAPIGPAFAMPAVAALSDLRIEDAAEHDVDGRVQFVGVIENHAANPARAVQIEVDYFRQGKIVDQYVGFVPGMVEAGGKRYFKVLCGTRDMRPDRHDDVKIQVVETH